MAPEPSCKACHKTAVLDDAIKFLVCSRCQTMTQGARKTYYCSKSCQTIDWPLHKPTICGKPLEPLPPTSSTNDTTPNLIDLTTLDTSTLSPSLTFHLAALKTLSSQLPPPPPPREESSFSPTSKKKNTERDLHPVPAYLFFPCSPLDSVVSSSRSASGSRDNTLPVPIHLSPPSHQLFVVLFHTAIRTSNPLSITLMYSLLITSIVALQGGERRLVEQLEQEFESVNVKEEIEKDREPTERELTSAIGGQQNLSLLLEWQMEEAERLRQEEQP